MRDAGRQVQNIACVRAMALVALEVLQENEVVTGGWALKQVLCRQSPLAHPDALAEEHVVIVTMGSDTAARGSKADHQVIDAPVRNERHQIEKFPQGWQVFLDVVNE